MIGLGVGLIWGIVDASTGPSYAMTAPTPVQEGLSMTLDVRRHDQSGMAEFPLLAGRF